MTVATRPPLRLTKGEASNWFSIHPEDIGREIVIVKTHVVDAPPAYVEAMRGFGRWQAGLAGRWPEWTVFTEDFLERPPSWATVQEADRPGTVTFRVMGEVVTYVLAMPEVSDEVFAIRLKMTESYACWGFLQ